jgi:hypothetical protein
MSGWAIALPFVIGLLITAAWYGVLLFFYAHRTRLQLEGAVNLDKALNELSTLFREGNVEILNRHIGADQYDAWHSDWALWHQKVQQHLETTLGLAEKNMFENLVVYQPLPLTNVSPQHQMDKSMLVKQLETLREIMIRHSERAAKWREVV